MEPTDKPHSAATVRIVALPRPLRAAMAHTASAMRSRRACPSTIFGMDPPSLLRLPLDPLGILSSCACLVILIHL